MLLKVGFDSGDECVARGPIEGCGQKLGDPRIRIHRREGFEIGRAPAAKEKTFGTKFRHAGE
jgi:hypothetical protein